MENEPINLNNEPNDIAGNRIDGPVGNTAAKPGPPGAGVGMPGGPPSHPVMPPAGSGPATPVSSEALADAETSAGQGAVDANTGPQENKPADPASLTTGDTYGGNFSNSTQGSYHDQARRDNQDSDPNRGEFGAQDLGGTTHGGFGNQNRLADYEPHNTPEDRYYGGPGAPGLQDNAYRRYDGRDERPDPRTEYGFEPGTAAAPGVLAAEGGPLPNQTHGAPGDEARRPGQVAAFQNDNGAPKGPGSSYAQDYGHTSLRSAAGPSPDAAATGPDQRNQTEDYLPAQSGTDSQGRHVAPASATAAPEGPRPASNQGYGDRGREEPNRLPDFATGNDRNGYVQPQANNGDAAQGIGSRGGSYNDTYDDSKPGSNAGSPAQGDQRSEGTTSNYGTAARQENRPAGEDSPDHGAPRRNAGRDGEADE